MLKRLDAAAPDGFVSTIVLSRRFQGIMLGYGPIVRTPDIEA